MQIITKMKRQRRDRERINIYLNDKYSFSLSFKSAEDLVVGQTLSSADKEKLLEVDLRMKRFYLRFLYKFKF